MTLAEKLSKWWDDTRQRAPAVFEAYLRFISELEAAEVAHCALKAGQKMPAFMLPNTEGKLVTSDQLLARGPLVLSFFRGGWCPYCCYELEALQEIHGDLKRLGATLAAVTPDTAVALARDKSDHQLDYDVLSDVDNGVALLFGLTFRVPDFVRRLWLDLGIDLAVRHGNSTGIWMLPVPATYIIDTTGSIRHARVDPDFRRRMEPTEILRHFRSL
jgi:peroxiredoxin